MKAKYESNTKALDFCVNDCSSSYLNNKEKISIIDQT